jgi:predicted nucleotidyltransferase
MDKSKVMNIVNSLVLHLLPVFHIQKVILYGSWVWGTPDDDSDIDVAVAVDRIDEDYLEALIKLYEISNTVDIRIEPILLEEKHDLSGFLKHILNHGEVLYDRKETERA